MGADTPSPRGWYEERYRTIYTNNEYLLYNYVLESAAYSQHIYDYNWGLFNTYETLNGQSSQYYYAYAGLSFKFSQKSRGNEVTGCWSPDSVATSSTISTWGTFE